MIYQNLRSLHFGDIIEKYHFPRQSTSILLCDHFSGHGCRLAGILPFLVEWPPQRRPPNSGFIHITFGNHSFQILSGLSSVIVCNRNSCKTMINIQMLMLTLLWWAWPELKQRCLSSTICHCCAIENNAISAMHIHTNVLSLRPGAAN